MIRGSGLVNASYSLASGSLRAATVVVVDEVVVVDVVLDDVRPRQMRDLPKRTHRKTWSRTVRVVPTLEQRLPSTLLAVAAAALTTEIA